MKNNKIIFTTEVAGLIENKKLQPQPSKYYMPEWYKNLPSDIKTVGKYNSKLIPNMKTVKLCPSFAEVFRQGYILFAPCDIYFRVDDDGFWEWRVSDEAIKCDTHEDEQMVKHIATDKVRKVFKIVSPWKAITPKGWSIYQIPLFYDFNDDWQVAYGILNTDVEHELNQQILYTSKKTEVLIKQGQPLNYIVPFQRKNILQYEVKPMNKKLQKKINISQRIVRSNFKSSIAYYKNSK